MKNLAVIAGAVGLGIKWNSELGWFIVAIAAIFLIINTKDHEQSKKEDVEG